MFKIEKNVGLPAGARASYPFAQMEVGDSFMAPNVPPKTLYQSAFSHSRRHGKKFVVRAEGAGARCWRVA